MWGSSLRRTTALLSSLLVVSIAYATPVRLQPQAPIETPTAVDTRDNLNKGVQAFRAKQFDAAIDYFKRAVELDPNFSSANLYLASAYVALYVPGEENRKYADLAIQTFQKVLDTKPNDKTALAGLASIYVFSSRYDKAREIYIKNAQVDPQNPDPNYGVGSVTWIIVHDASSSFTPEERTRLIEEGLRYLDKAMSLNPAFEDTYWYENLLDREQSNILKERARTTEDMDAKATLLAKAAEWDARADAWVNEALEVRKKNTENNRNLGIPVPGR
jgi:tetratricopeptide (TPR) repeat protein